MWKPHGPRNVIFSGQNKIISVLTMIYLILRLNKGFWHLDCASVFEFLFT